MENPPMPINRSEWLTLGEVAQMFEPPITSEALRLRLFKPNAPAHRKWRGRWLVKRDDLPSSNWLE